MTADKIPPLGWITVDGELYQMDLDLNTCSDPAWGTGRWRKVFLLKEGVRVAQHSLPGAAFQRGGVQCFFTSGRHYVAHLPTR